MTGGHHRVGAAIHRVQQRLLFPLLGLDSDNGSEFINHNLYAYCQRKGITFTRSRSFFQPVMKLVKKTRHGARVHKVYDTAQTPYQRLLNAGILTEASRQELAAVYHDLSPVVLLQQINESLERLWDMAEHPKHDRIKEKHLETSVTPFMTQPCSVR